MGAPLPREVVLPWNKDRFLDVKTVRRLIGEQFPELSPVGVRYFDEGWDSEIYEVNGSLLFRFPKRRDRVRSFRNELDILSQLEHRLNLPIPEFRWLGRSTSDFPYPFAGYPKLPGVQASCSDPSRVDRGRAARELGNFLSRLHAFPVRRARALGIRRHRPLNHEHETRQYRRNIGLITSAIPSVLQCQLKRFLKGPFETWPKGRTVLCHSDLMPEHILLTPDGRRVSGIIDWSDMGIGHPAFDLVFALCWLGESFLEEVLCNYTGNITGQDRAWIRERAVIVALDNVLYGSRSKRKDYVRDGVRSLFHAIKAVYRVAGTR